MVKLYLKYTTDEESSEYGSSVSFEYESKEKFIADVREFYKNHKWKYLTIDHSPYRTVNVEIFDDAFLCKGAIDNLEEYIFTPEEWFERKKITNDYFKFLE
jgi:hypothetical protein